MYYRTHPAFLLAAAGVMAALHSGQQLEDKRKKEKKKRSHVYGFKPACKLEL